MRKLLAVIAGGAVFAGAVCRVRRTQATGDLRDRTVLVTGGTRGLGLLLARGFGAVGCRVAVCARDEDEMRTALADLRTRGVDAYGVVCDLRDPTQVTTMVERADADLGGLDIVVNNAGEIQVAPVDALNRKAFESAMESMFWGSLDVARAALPRLRERGGSLVTITSVGGKVSPPHLLPYSCAKFAQVALSEGLGAEVAKDGVHVLTVVPGLMRTGSHRRAVFAGAPAREYTWFALGASLPFVSMDGERAALRIIEAVARRRNYLALHPLTWVTTAVHGICPQATLGVTRVMGWLLPRSRGEPATPGPDAAARADNMLLRRLTRLNDTASQRFNQLSRKEHAQSGVRE